MDGSKEGDGAGASNAMVGTGHAAMNGDTVVGAAGAGDGGPAIAVDPAIGMPGASAGEANGASKALDSLQMTDAVSAAVAQYPRVTLADIENAIAERYDVNAWEGVAATAGIVVPTAPIWTRDQHPLRVLSVCFLVTKNGFTVIGKSAPAAAANFNADVGKQFAYEDAVRQLWPLMGFALRDRLHRDKEPEAYPQT